MLPLIDLDAVPPARPATRRRHGRGLRSAIAAGLLLVVLGGPVPARAGEVVPVAETGGGLVSAFLLTTATLYAAHLEASTDRIVVEALPLAPGGPRWSTEMSGVRPSLSLDRSGTTLVIWPGLQGRVTFLDAATGRVRWRAPDLGVARVLDDRVVLTDPQYDNSPSFDSGPPFNSRPAFGSGRPSVVRMADLTTGRVVWERPGSALAFDVDAAQGLVLGIDEGGRATVYSAADGTVRAGVRNLGVDPYEWGVGLRNEASAEEIIGDTVYVHSWTDVAAYRLGDLDLLWRRRVASPQSLAACGALICAAGPGGATALEAATGRTLWTDPRWQVVTGGSAVARNGSVSAIDPATGQVRAELGRGVVAGDLMLRFDGATTWVTRLADRDLLGALSVIAPSPCSAAGVFLACSTGRAVAVWRIKGRVR